MKRIYATLAAAAIGAASLMAADLTSADVQVKDVDFRAPVAPTLMSANDHYSLATLKASNQKYDARRAARRAEGEAQKAATIDNIGGDFMVIYMPYFINYLQQEMSCTGKVNVLEGNTVEVYGLADLYEGSHYKPEVTIDNGIIATLNEEGNLDIEIGQIVGSWNYNGTIYDIALCMLAPSEEDPEELDLYIGGTYTMEQSTDGIFEAADPETGLYLGLFTGEATDLNERTFGGGFSAQMNPMMIEPNHKLNYLFSRDSSEFEQLLFVETVADAYDNVINMTSPVEQITSAAYTTSFTITDAESGFAYGEDVVATSEYDSSTKTITSKYLGMKMKGLYTDTEGNQEENKEIFFTEFLLGTDPEAMLFPDSNYQKDFEFTSGATYMGASPFCFLLYWQDEDSEEGSYWITYSFTDGVITPIETRFSSIKNITADEAVANGEAVYYNLQGVRVANPTNGIYIKREGSKASKVLVK